MAFITEQHTSKPISDPIITVINEDDIRFGSPTDPVFVTPEIYPSEVKNVEKESMQDTENNDFISFVVDSLLNYDTSPNDFPPEVLDQALPLIKATKLDYVKEKNYIMADKVKKIQNEVSHAITLAHFSQQCSNQIQSILEKQMTAQNDLDLITKEWDNRYEELENQIDIKKRQLYFELNSEMQKFEMEAEYQLKNVKYKPSPQTLSIRKKEDGLVKNENYLEAEKIKRKAERLESQQGERCKSRLMSDIEFNRKSLFDKQNNQFQIIEQWAEERRKDYDKAREIEVQAALRRVQYYDKMLLNINQKGFSPNPNLGFTTINISKKEAFKATKRIDTQSLSKMTSPIKTKRKKISALCYRPAVSVNQRYRTNKAPTRSSYTRKVNSFL
ncbi:hypothetical protein M9Y10_029313 [Tritrichomonas musculus]|uniref:Uncharacterized protein n=1 Tax=Tritrichomonas musculus TaxID=1915356 RepID=A0ABR2KLZ6_9EUKA